MSFTFSSLLEPFQFITYFVYARFNFPCYHPPPGHSPGQVQSFGLGDGDFFKAILPGGRGRGKSKLASHVFVKYVITRAVDMMAADPETPRLLIFEGKRRNFSQSGWARTLNLKQYEICTSCSAQG